MKRGRSRPAEPGRAEGVTVTPPAGVSVTARPDDTLNNLLAEGELDAVIAAHPPTDFERETGRVVRLFSNYREVEEDWYRRTGIFPIMHVLTLRAEIHQRHPWIAMNLLSAFEAAKRRSLDRMLDFAARSGPRGAPMKTTIAALATKIRELEDELETEITQRRAELRFTVHERKVRFEDEVRRRHRAPRLASGTTCWAHVRCW